MMILIYIKKTIYEPLLDKSNIFGYAPREDMHVYHPKMMKNLILQFKVFVFSSPEPKAQR